MRYLVSSFLFVVVPVVGAWWLAANTAEAERRFAWLLIAADGSVTAAQVSRARACLGLARIALLDGLDRRRAAAVLGGAGEQIDALVLARRVRQRSGLSWRVVVLAGALRYSPGLVTWLLVKGVSRRVVPCGSGDPISVLEALLVSLLDSGSESTGTGSA